MGIFFFLLLAGRVMLLQDSDTFWHIAAGHQVLETGRFITTDPFTFTFQGEQWVAYEWMSECLLAVIDDVAGFDGLVLATAAMLAWFYAWVGGRLVRGGMHWIVALYILALAVSASSNNFQVRPHLCTIPFLGVTFSAICAVERKELDLHKLWWLVPLFALWTNLHGGVLGGIGTLGIAAAGWTAARFLKLNSPIETHRQLISLFALVAACSLAPLINPYGYKVIQTWQFIMSAKLPEFIVEHAPMQVLSTRGLLVLMLAGLYGVIFLGTLRKMPCVSWLIPIVWFYLGLTRNRHVPLFAVLAVLTLPEMIPNSRWIDFLRRRQYFQQPESGPVKWHRANLCIFVSLPAALFLAAIIARSAVEQPAPGGFFAKPHSKVWPEELLPDLRRYEKEHPPGTPIFNDMAFGGFLIYNTPDLRVFIDGRCELFGDTFFFQYLDLERNPEELEHWAEEYGFDAALVNSRSTFDRYLDTQETWTLIRRTPMASFYVRRKPP